MFKLAKVNPDSLDTCKGLMEEIYQEDKSYWPYGLSVHGHDDLYLVREKQASAPVGFVGFQKMPDNTGKMIGYYTVGIKRACRNRGFAKEAINKMLDEKRTEVEELRAMICNHNTPSITLADHLGIPTDIHKAASMIGNNIQKSLEHLGNIDAGHTASIESDAAKAAADAAKVEADRIKAEQDLIKQQQEQKKEQKEIIKEQKQEQLEEKKERQEVIKEEQAAIKQQLETSEKVKQVGEEAIRKNMQVIQKQEEAKQLEEEAKLEQEQGGELQEMSDQSFGEDNNPFAKSVDDTSKTNMAMKTQNQVASLPKIDTFYGNAFKSSSLNKAGTQTKGTLLANVIGAGRGVLESLVGAGGLNVASEKLFNPGLDAAGVGEGTQTLNTALNTGAGAIIPHLSRRGSPGRIGDMSKQLLTLLAIKEPLLFTGDRMAAGAPAQERASANILSATEKLKKMAPIAAAAIGIPTLGYLGFNLYDRMKKKKESERNNDIALQIPGSKLSDTFLNSLSREMLFYTPAQKKERIAELQGVKKTASTNKYSKYLKSADVGDFLSSTYDTVAPWMETGIDVAGKMYTQPFVNKLYGMGRGILNSMAPGTFNLPGTPYANQYTNNYAATRAMTDYGKNKTAPIGYVQKRKMQDQQFANTMTQAPDLKVKAPFNTSVFQDQPSTFTQTTV